MPFRHERSQGHVDKPGGIYLIGRKVVVPIVLGVTTHGHRLRLGAAPPDCFVLATLPLERMSLAVQAN